MTTIHAKPHHGDIIAARREHASATLRFAVGIAVSIAGIALLAGMLLVLLPLLGPSPTVAQGFGVVLLAAVAFAASAWGTDLRHAAQKTRRMLRARIAVLARTRAS